MKSFEIKVDVQKGTLKLRVNYRCFCHCLFDVIVELHAMDAKKNIDFLIGK